MGNENREQNYERWKAFFHFDKKIREIINNSRPEESDNYSDETKKQYLSKLLKQFEEAEKEVLAIFETLGIGEQVKDKVLEKFKILEEKILAFEDSSQSLNSLYEETCSSCSNELSEEVKRVFVAYDFIDEENLQNCVEKIQSLNELYDVLHSYVVNNIEYIQSLPIVQSIAFNNDDSRINLYGVDTGLAQEIYKEFPQDIEAETVDIVPVPDETLVVIRNRGNSLTIEIREIEDRAAIKYFIARIFERDVNNLLGANEVTNHGVIGQFEVAREEAAKMLCDFVKENPIEPNFISARWNYQLSDAIEELRHSQEHEAKAQEHQHKNVGLFGIKDARDMAMESGRKMNGILGTLRNIESKVKEKFIHKEGEDKHDEPRD